MALVFAIKARARLRALVKALNALRIKHQQMRGRCVAEMAGTKKDPKGDARERYRKVIGVLAGLRLYQRRIHKLSRNKLCVWFAESPPRADLYE